MDGYGIYGPLASDSSEAGALDECNGAEDDNRGYHYHAASPELNQHIGCFHGKTTQSKEAGGGDRPNFEAAATSLGVTSEALKAAMDNAGGREADLSDVAEQLGVSEDALREALPQR